LDYLKYEAKSGDTAVLEISERFMTVFRISRSPYRNLAVE